LTQIFKNFIPTKETVMAKEKQAEPTKAEIKKSQQSEEERINRAANPGRQVRRGEKGEPQVNPSQFTTDQESAPVRLSDRDGATPGTQPRATPAKGEGELPEGFNKRDGANPSQVTTDVPYPPAPPNEETGPTKEAAKVNPDRYPEGKAPEAATATLPGTGTKSQAKATDAKTAAAHAPKAEAKAGTTHKTGAQKAKESKVAQATGATKKPGGAGKLGGSSKK
jgi:hypothetical protein